MTIPTRRTSGAIVRAGAVRSADARGVAVAGAIVMPRVVRAPRLPLLQITRLLMVAVVVEVVGRALRLMRISSGRILSRASKVFSLPLLFFHIPYPTSTLPSLLLLLLQVTAAQLLHYRDTPETRTHFSLLLTDRTPVTTTRTTITSTTSTYFVLLLACWMFVHNNTVTYIYMPVPRSQLLRLNLFALLQKRGTGFSAVVLYMTPPLCMFYTHFYV